MKICVFYHCLLSAKHRVIPEDYALDMIMNQMSALMASGLSDAAAEVKIHVNGSFEETLIVQSVCPEKAQMYTNGSDCNSEIPTLIHVRQWCQANPGCAVLYHHTKGVSTPHMADGWRQRMETFMVWNWQNCLVQLQQGKEAVGCHWLTPEANPGTISSPFFGGNFWWANSGYINRLPALPVDTWENRYEAESWIGRGAPRPIVFDPSPGWPSL